MRLQHLQEVLVDARERIYRLTCSLKWMGLSALSPERRRNERRKGWGATERLNKLAWVSKWIGEAKRKEAWFTAFSPHLFRAEKLVGAITLSITQSLFGRCEMSCADPSSATALTDHQGVALGRLVFQNWIATIQSVIIIVLQASMISFNYILPGRELEKHIQSRLCYLFTRHCKLNPTSV